MCLSLDKALTCEGVSLNADEMTAVIYIAPWRGGAATKRGNSEMYDSEAKMIMARDRPPRSILLWG